MVELTLGAARLVASLVRFNGNLQVRNRGAKPRNIKMEFNNRRIKGMMTSKKRKDIKLALS